MTELNYEFSTSEQNANLSHDFNVIQSALTGGTLTLLEANFLFQKWVTEDYTFDTPERVIQVCTNRPNFKALSKGEN